MVPRKSGSVKDQKSESVTLKTFWFCIQARELFAPDLISIQLPNFIKESFKSKTNHLVYH